MEPKTGKESVVSRLFGFGRKAKKKSNGEDVVPEETGFAIEKDVREEELEDDGRVTIPEQVIRIKTGQHKRKDDTVQAIGDTFTELTRMLGSVSDRLDRQDSRTGDLTAQLSELPEYLRTLPRMQQEQTDALRMIGDRMSEGTEALARLPLVQEEQTRAVHSLTERMAEGTEAINSLPEKLAEQAESQKDAIEKVANSNERMAKVVYASNKKSL